MSDPKSQLVSDKELELDDSKCQQIVSDVLHSLSALSNSPSKHVDEELMLMDEEHQIVSDPPSMQLDEKLMLFDEEHQIASDPPSVQLDEELMLMDEEHQIDSDPPSMHLDEKLMLFDEEHQMVSNQLDGLSEDLKLDSNECQVAPDHVHVLSDSSEPLLLPLDEVETILEVDSHPFVEKESQVKEEKLELNFNANIVEQVTKIMSGPSDLPSKDLHESKTVYDQLHVLSDLSESPLQSAEELVCNDKEVMDIPPVKEVLNVNEVELAPESIKKPAEVDNLEYCTFSLENPRFSVILSKSQVDYKCVLTLPGIMVKVLPRTKVPVVLNCYGKIWTMFYNGHLGTKTFNASDWRKFVVDHELKVGDCCFFELLENNPKKIVFKVVIMRTDASPSCDEEEGAGESSEKPILID